MEEKNMLTGKTHRYGDNVDTDVIIPARYLTSSDPDALKAHCLEDLDPAFAGKVSPGDVIVAGANFGCGSSREHAPLAIKAAGVSCVIAGSFARIFFRNSFNIGLPILESAEAAAGIEAGDEVEVDLATGRIRDLSKGIEFQAQPVPEFMQELIRDGGLIEHTKKRIAAGKVKPRVAEVETAPVEEGPKAPGARMLELEKAAAADKGRDAPWEAESPAPKGSAAAAQDDDDEDEE
jgi:3-isopropylmalate dehydratase small subunit